MKNWRNVCKNLAVAGALVGIVGTNYALASSADTSFTFKYPVSGVGVQYTDKRVKENYTAVYFHPTYILPTVGNYMLGQ